MLDGAFGLDSFGFLGLLYSAIPGLVALCIVGLLLPRVVCTCLLYPVATPTDELGWLCLLAMRLLCLMVNTMYRLYGHGGWGREKQWDVT